MDAFKNFAISAVATAPSPATSGTSLVVTSGTGGRFPTAPFNATIQPAGQAADPTNAEIVRVTSRSGDTLTITRAQESTTARTVVVGDIIVATITAKTMSDIDALRPIGPSILGVESSAWYSFTQSNSNNSATVNSSMYQVMAVPMWLKAGLTFRSMACKVATAMAGGSVSIGVATCNIANMFPDKILRVCDVASAATTGEKIVDFTGGDFIVPYDGIYYGLLKAMHASNTTMTMNATNQAPAHPLLQRVYGGTATSPSTYQAILTNWTALTIALSLPAVGTQLRTTGWGIEVLPVGAPSSVPLLSIQAR